MKLFEPIWKTNKTEKLDEALASVREITDPKKLREAAVTAGLPEVQSEALKRITDQKVLREIILADSTVYEIKREAVRRISDPEILTEIAMLRQAYPADGEAIAMISDQDRLLKIALSEQGGEQDKAVYKISDQQVLAEIAATAKKSSVRKTAIRNITDPGTLIRIMNEAKEVYTRSEAFEHLVRLKKSGKLLKLSEEQHGMLLDAIIREEDLNARIELDEFQRTDDLNRIYREAARYDLRAKAISRLVTDDSFPNSSLLEAWKTADSSRKTIYNTYSNPWQDAEHDIENRVAAASAADPELLLDFVRDPAAGSEYAAACLQRLFETDHPDPEKIKYLRDEAFAAYLRNIPQYAAADQKPSLEEYLLRLARAVPREFHDDYGLSVFMEEREE